MTQNHSPVKLLNIKAFFIDFDGTLADSLGTLYKVYQQFLESYGIQGTHQEFQSLIGPTIPEIIRRITEHHKIQQPTLELISHYNDLLDLVYHNEVNIFEGEVEFLQWAKEHHYLMVIVSSASQKIVMAFLEANHLSQYFTKIITAEQVSQGKPHPEIYQKALDSVHLKPEEAIAIEDSIHGICSATNAGILTLGIHDVHHLFDYSFKNWTELLAFLKKCDQYEKQLSDTKNIL